jgi:amino acid adenylation domain-containing protein/non-ribosomal peptide synthase protein (TIGR01720 family)
MKDILSSRSITAFLKTGSLESIALETANKQLSYKELWSEVSLKSQQLECVTGRLVAVHCEDPLIAIINVLSVLEAGGYALLISDLKLHALKDTFTSEVIKDLIVFTDSKNTQNLSGYQKIEENTSNENSLTINVNEAASKIGSGGLILASPGQTKEAYMLSIDDVKQHVTHTVSSFKLENTLKLIPGNSFLVTDLLEWVLPALAANATLYLEEMVKEIDTNPSESLLIKLTKADLHSNKLKGLSKKYGQVTDCIIISGDLRISNGDAQLIRDYFPKVKELKFTHQLPNLNYSVIEGAVSILDLDVKTLHSLAYTRPFGKANVAIINEYYQPVMANVPANLVYESPALGTSIGKEQYILTKTIRNSERSLRKIPFVASLSAKGEISLLHNEARILDNNGKKIFADLLEEALLHNSKVDDAVVKLLKIANQKYTVAFVKLSGEKSVSPSSLRKWLKRFVPSEMLPEHIEIIPDIVRNLEGSIDQSQFEAFNIQIITEQDFSIQEKQVAGLWKRVLETDKIHRDDNFFELGGHSLLATKLVSLIQEELKLHLTIKDVFVYPVFSDMIRLLQSKKVSDAVVINAHNIQENEKAPLSFAQERLWFIDQFQGSAQYNVPAILDVRGELDRHLLEKAISEIIKRHKALRTVIQKENGVAYQMVTSPEWELQYEEIETQELAKNRIQKIIDTPFVLSKDCMLRALLIKRNEKAYTLAITIHHIALDGWSAYIVLNELQEIYESLLYGKLSELPEPSIQYSDYAIWQREFINGDYLDQELAYWTKQLDSISYLELPLDFPRPAQQQFNGKRKTFEVDNTVYESLAELSQLEGATLFMTLLSAFKVLLYKYTGQKDVCVGSPIAGRHYAELENMVGFFANTLALRSNLEISQGFTDLLEQVKETTLDAYSHQDVPFEKIVDALGIEREMNRTPVFQVMFSMENVPQLNSLKMGGLVLNNMPVEQNTTQFDWNIYMEESEDTGLIFHIEYDTDLFREDTIERFGNHFKYLLNSIAVNPDQSISKLALMSKQDELKLIADFNDNRANFPFDLTTDALIDKIALKYPEKIAVKDANVGRTYAGLKENASKLAGLLYHKINIKQEAVIALLADRSVNFIESVYGIWKSGGVYLPVHPELPQNRIAIILANAEVETLCVSKKYLDIAIALLSEQVSLKQIVCIDDTLDRDLSVHEGCFFYDSSHLNSVEPLHNSLSNIDSLAYVIYTSGSTGMPKGAMLEHRGMLNHLFIMIKDLHIGSESNIAQNASQSFDISVWQMFTALITGGTSIIYSHWETLQVQKFAEQLTKDQITLLQLVPSYLTVLLDEMDNHEKDFFQSLQYLLVTGETVKKNLLERWFNKCSNIKVVNAYGPTEAADDITLYIMDRAPESSSIPIGVSLANLNIYIVNEDEQFCPVGVKGEIWVSGLGVGRGYLNDPEKTKLAFINDPFQGARQTRLYKTGDLGRFLPDGNIEFFGRKDYQVKVNGYRIELEEIEQYLSQLSEVKEAIVIVDNTEEEVTQLLGFVTCYSQVSVEELKQELAGYLPNYMVPSRIVLVDTFPLTPNGKVDRKKLPSLATVEKATSTPVDNVVSKTEKVLIEIWKELLDLPEVGLTQSFFELGGHSLKVISMISQIQKQLEAEVMIKDVFACPTVKALASFIDEAKTISYEPIPLVDNAPYYPVSNAQKRLWVLDRFVEDVSAYNSYNAYVLNGSVNVEAFSEATLSIINRHEILRTTFIEKEGEPMQLVHADVKKDDICQVIDYSNSPKGYDEAIEELKVVANIPFNLSDELLFKSRIYILGEDTYIFFCCMHHIICDGWSNNILVKEILKNYRSFEKRQVSALPSLKIQYKDYASWNLKQVASEEFLRHKNYWHNKLSGDLPVLNLPSYNKRPGVQVFDGNAIEYTFSKDILDGLKKISKRTNGSLFITLTSFLNILFHKYTGQKDIIIGTGTAGRTHPDLENQLGYYINTLVLRNYIDPKKPFLEIVNEVKENTIEAFDHQDYPFDKLVNELDFERDISRNPIFDVMILLQSFDEDEDSLLAEGLDDTKITPITLEGHGSPFDMDFDFTEAKDELNLILTYNSVIYTENQMENMVKHFEILMERVLDKPTDETGNISIITKEEEDFISTINATDKTFDLEKTYHHYLEKFARETPSKTAVIFEDKKTSYAALNALSNQLARAILSRVEIHKDTLVGVFMDRSDLMMATIFGIWKATGAYIPLEKKMPDNRIVSCAIDAGLKAVIADKDLVSKDLGENLEANTTVLYIQDLLEEARQENTDDLKLGIDPNSLCVTIFTSGSTGNPKGAMNEHKGRMNHALSTIDYLGMDANSVLIQNASHSFDISIWQTFTAIVSGGTTLILEDELVNSPERLLENILSNKATIFQLVPSYLSMLLEIIAEDNKAYPLTLKNLISCGEAINPKSILQWQKLYPETVFVNDYGPAEASDGTTWNVFNEIASETSVIPIGKPIYNMKNYIVDAHMNLSPVGVVGEICVAGVGVGRGYVNDEEKTKSVFKLDPFCSDRSQRLYKTGDLGKLLPNGMIQFYGRKDYQVKVNGQRIELGEIEAKLLEVPGVKEVAVIDKTHSNNGRKYLIAFVALKAGCTLDAQSIKSAIGKELPIYMVPAEIHLIDHIPITQNGKIDRKYLNKLTLNGDDVHNEYVAPETDVEKVLVEAWKSVLDIEHIGITDNFYESGGDSIAAIQVSSYLYKNEYQVEVKDIMRFPHIREVAEFVKPLSRIADQGMILGTVELTSIQASFFKMQKSVPDHYNQSVLLKSKDLLDPDALQTSFSKLLEWHDILRASFKKSSSGTYVQVIGDNCEAAKIEVHNYNESNDLQKSKEVANNLQASLSIEKGVLLKAAVLKMQKADYLLIVIHHLVIDTVSWRILIEDLTTAYEHTINEEVISLPVKTDSFKLWSQVLREFTRSSKFNEEVKYWSACASTPFENITYEYPSGVADALVKNKKTMSVTLGAEYVTKLETEVHKAFNTEINDILLAALALSVKKCFGLLTVPIMLESHGRVKLKEDININRTVGWFTSEFPVLLDTSEAENLANFIKIVKDYLHKVPNSGIGYGLLKFIAKGRNSEIVDAATPQIAFNYLGKVDDEDGTESIFQWEDKTLGNEECIQNQSDYALEIVAMGREGFLEFNLEYHDSQFNEDTISKWLEIYINILQELIDFCANRSHSEVTPTDFDYSDLSLQDLNELNDLF